MRSVRAPAGRAASGAGQELLGLDAHRRAGFEARERRERAACALLVSAFQQRLTEVETDLVVAGREIRREPEKLQSVRGVAGAEQRPAVSIDDVRVERRAAVCALRILARLRIA